MLKDRQHNEFEHKDDDDPINYVVQRCVQGQVLVPEGVKRGNEMEEKREEAEIKGETKREEVEKGEEVERGEEPKIGEEAEMEVTLGEVNDKN